MRCLIKTTLLLLMAALANAQPQIIETNDKITAVTVFTNGAQINRQGKVTLKPGHNTVRFTGVPYQIDINSLQTELENKNARILAITPTKITNYTEPTIDNKAKQLKDQIKTKKDALTLLTDDHRSLESEADLLKENTKQIGGEETGLTAEKLKTVADLYRTRLKDISRLKLSNTNQQLKIKEQIEELNKEYRKIIGQVNKTIWQIDVLVACNANITANIGLSYYSTNAQWIPTYNLRAQNIETDLDLEYNAKVINRTGEDWPAVPLVLSTGQASQGLTKPNLLPWHLRINTPMYRAAKQSANTLEATAFANDGGWGAPAQAEEVVITGPASTTFETDLNVTFTITNTYPIPADNKPHTVEVAKHKLPANYVYFTTPKIEEQAYLIARVGNWQKLNLIPGEAAVYFGGSFNGTTQLNTNLTTDTLELPLGTDSRIAISRNRLTNFKDKTFLTGKNQKRLRYELTVKNNNSKAVNVVVTDQIPISTTEEIEIEVNEITANQTPQKHTGQLVWKLNLPPTATQKLVVDFTVTYPRNKTINLLH